MEIKLSLIWLPSLSVRSRDSRLMVRSDASDETNQVGIHPKLAALLKACWKQNPQKRPTPGQVCVLSRTYLFEARTNAGANQAWALYRRHKSQTFLAKKLASRDLCMWRSVNLLINSGTFHSVFAVLPACSKIRQPRKVVAWYQDHNVSR